MKTARQITVEALMKVNKGGGYSNLVIDNSIAASGLDVRDAGFATALFYGVLERMITLDHCIKGFSNMKLEKLSPPVREILRMSLYQLMYMDTVPESAAVNEGVNLAKTMGQEKAAGLINGILRSFIRAGKRVPRMAGTRADQLSIQYSAPAPMIEMLIDSYGEEAAIGVLATSLGRPPVYVRVNTMKTTVEALLPILEQEGIVADTDTGTENALRLSATGDITSHASFKAGLYHVQDLSSQLCCKALDVQSGQRVIDVCAAPGGKTFTLAQLLAGEGTVLALDLHASRTRLIREGAKRLGLPNVETKENDATSYNSTFGEFDRVLCDVPCSGFGIIRRKPEIKYKKQEDIGELPQIQYKILENSSKYCKADGILVYSTCTLNKQENEAVIERFLKEHSEFCAEPLLAAFGEAGYYKTFFPHIDSSDGFFVATVRAVGK